MDTWHEKNELNEKLGAMGLFRLFRNQGKRPMSYLDIIKKIEQVPDGKASDKMSLEEAGPLLAVKIGGSVIGDFWLILDEAEPFDPGDGLPTYRPSEARALMGKIDRPEAFQAVHRVKTIFDGRILS